VKVSHETVTRDGLLHTGCLAVRLSPKKKALISKSETRFTLIPLRVRHKFRLSSSVTNELARSLHRRQQKSHPGACAAVLQRRANKALHQVPLGNRHCCNPCPGVAANVRRTAFAGCPSLLSQIPRHALECSVPTRETRSRDEAASIANRLPKTCGFIRPIGARGPTGQPAAQPERM
jgi:hypothetical protein